jgi:hypothetical protein
VNPRSARRRRTAARSQHGPVSGQSVPVNNPCQAGARGRGHECDACVLLWAQPGARDGLIAYEDRVLSLVPDTVAGVLQRARSNGANGQPPNETWIRGFHDAG